MNLQSVFTFLTLCLSVLWEEIVAEYAPSCGVNRVFRDVTLYGGMNAGKFVAAPDTKTIEDCVTHCCLDPKFDLVFKINDYCFCVMCKTIWACRSKPVPRPPLGFKSTVVTLLRASPGTDIYPGRPATQPATQAPTRRVTNPPTRRTTRKPPRPTKPTRKPTTRPPKTEKPVITTKPTTRVTTYPPPFVSSATGFGNKHIPLRCQGKIRILRVVAFNTEGDQSTIDGFQNFCDGNMITNAGQRLCYVSLSSVFKVSYPDDTETIVWYQCTPGMMT